MSTSFERIKFNEMYTCIFSGDNSTFFTGIIGENYLISNKRVIFIYCKKCSLVDINNLFFNFKLPVSITHWFYRVIENLKFNLL